MLLDFIHIPKTAGVSICSAIGQTHGHRPRKIKQGAFVFSCVRNPYDRAVSLYYFLRDKAPNYKEQIMIEGETVNTYWEERINQIRPVRFLQPQKAWVEDVERIDKLIRFETLAEDWAEMRQAFELPALEHKNGDTSRPSTPWQEELTAESIAKIGEIYSDDFKYFNYKRIL